MGKSKVNKSSNVQQNVSTKQKNNLEKNEKTMEIAPSISKNTKSGKTGPMMDNIIDENDFYDEKEYTNNNYSEEEEEEEYSDESYEFDEAETAQEAFEAKYYHNRRTSSANNKNSYTNKISLKKVNTLLANQNIMVIDKNQLSETMNNSGLLSARVPTTPNTTPVKLDNQKNAEPTAQVSNSIDLTALCSNTSLTSNGVEENGTNNEMVTSTGINSNVNTTNNKSVNEEENMRVNENNNKNKKNRKYSKKYENGKIGQYVTEDADGFIKSKKTKNRNSASSSKTNSNNGSSEQLNKMVSLTEQSDNTSTTQSQIQSQPLQSGRGSIQISVDKKQIQILCGAKSTPIKISENKNLAIIVNPSSVQESDIQELLVSPTKSRCKNNKPPVPVISSSPYTKNHNKRNNRNNSVSNINTSKPSSPQKSSPKSNDLLSPTKASKKGKNHSMIAESPLFAGSYPPLINTSPSKFSCSQQVDQKSIDFKYNLLNEYNMKKSASPTEKSAKNRFLKDESENNEEPQLSKKERKALKKLKKNKKLNEEFEALNKTRKTYVVNNGDDEVYQSIFGGQCDPEEPELENTSNKKSHKKNNKSLSKQNSKQQAINDEDDNEELESPSKKRNNKKNQKQKQMDEEEETNIPKKKNNKKNAKNKKNGNVEENDDDAGTNRKHSKKSKHQELEFNIEDIDGEDDLFNITSNPSGIRNKKTKKSARN